MSDRLIKLLLIDPDPIYRTGLRVVLEKFADLQIIAEAQTSADALQILSRLANNATSSSVLGVELAILELRLDNSQLSLYQQIKTQYPQLPVLLLTSNSEASQLVAAQQAGVEGYCPKGVSVTQLVAAIQQVAAGNSYWLEETGNRKQETKVRERGRQGERETRRIPPSPLYSLTFSPLARVRDRWRLSGLRHIDTVLGEVTVQLEDPGLPLLERSVFAGQRRELLAARWLLNQLLAAPVAKRQETGNRRQEIVMRAGEAEGEKSISTAHTLRPTPYTPHPSLATHHSSLFASVRSKLQFRLLNLTRVPLEIDILREEKKRELLDLILRKIEDILGELRFSQVQLGQLSEIRNAILGDLWQTATIDFFGKYSKLQVGEYQVDIAKTLLQDAGVVQTAILNEIPLVEELFAYLLFASPLVIDNVTFAPESVEAKERTEIILQNLLIQVANGVMQPLLNRFADVEVIKQKYYDRNLISTREIERFRNNLSWKYRLENYLQEPAKIFESRYELFLLVSRGIAKISIYAPRRQELARLSGIPLVVTLALEIRDAIAPRLRAVVAFFGKGIVYVLTQVIGRAIGLVGRGILQGLGGSLQENKNKRL